MLNNQFNLLDSLIITENKDEYNPFESKELCYSNLILYVVMLTKIHYIARVLTSNQNSLKLNAQMKTFDFKFDLNNSLSRY